MTIQEPNGPFIELPRALPGEGIDILSFVVTRRGWIELDRRMMLHHAGEIRVLTRLIYAGARDLIACAGATPKSSWRHLPGNHAKAILYSMQRRAFIGSPNVTWSSLAGNIEISHEVDRDEFAQLSEFYERAWSTSAADESAVIHPIDRRLVEEMSAGVRALIPDPLEVIGEELPSEYIFDPIPASAQFEYQRRIVAEIANWLARDERAGRGRILTLPPGAGKTLIAAEALCRMLVARPGSRVLWTCHVLDVLGSDLGRFCAQAGPEVRTYFPPHVVRLAQQTPEEHYARAAEADVVFCPKRSLPKLLLQDCGHFDVLVVDECHRFHAGSQCYSQLRDEYPDARLLGLSYTLSDADWQRFGETWEIEETFGAGISREQLVSQGILSQTPPTKSWPTGMEFELTGQRGRNRYEDQIIAKVREFDCDEVNDAVVDAFGQHRVACRRILAFAVDQDHAEKLLERMKARYGVDIAARVIHSGRPYWEIRAAYEWFRDDAAECRLLLSVLMLAEGTDLPKIDCLFMIRPTFSRVLYGQMLGRGLRGEKVGGTPTCVVQDFTYQFVDDAGEVIQVGQADFESGLKAQDVADESDDEPDDGGPGDQPDDDELDQRGPFEYAYQLGNRGSFMSKGVDSADAASRIARERSLAPAYRNKICYALRRRPGDLDYEILWKFRNGHEVR